MKLLKKSGMSADPYSNDLEYQNTRLVSEFPPPYFPPAYAIKEAQSPVRQSRFRSEENVSLTLSVPWMSCSEEFKDLKFGEIKVSRVRIATAHS